MAKQRPTGITLLAVAFIILGALSFIWSLLIFGVGAVAGLTGSIIGAENVASLGGANVFGGMVGMASAVLNFIVAFGLLTLKPWAWLLALIGVGLNVVSGVLGIFEGGFFALCCGLLGLLVPGAILFYLLRPEIRRVFGR